MAASRFNGRSVFGRNAATGLTALAAAAMLLVAEGCTHWNSRPDKQVVTPGGGQPVLTTAELKRQAAASGNANSNSPPGALPAPGPGEPRPFAVSRAAFEQPVEPQPLKPFDKWSEQDAAEQALGLIGRSAVAELAAATQSPVPARRLKAAETLGRIGPDAAPAVPQLVGLLDDPEEQIRKAAIRTLGQIGPAAKDAVPALVQTLLEERSESR